MAAGVLLALSAGAARGEGAAAPTPAAPRSDFMGNLRARLFDDAAFQAWIHGPTATGGWQGWRDWLGAAGIYPTVSYTADILGNPVGGKRHKVRYFHDIFAGLELDLETIAEIPGAALQVSMSSRAGNSLSDEDIGNVFNVSQVCCQPHTRLVTLAWEQSLLDKRVNVRLGRLSIGDDFATSPLYTAFVTSGIDANPGALAINAPSFSEYPNSSLGLRLRVHPWQRLALQLAVYDGDPDGTRTGAEDFNLSFSDGVLIIAESRYRHLWGPASLPGHYSIGGYYHTGRSSSLNPPADATADAAEHGNGGMYVTVDQQLVRFGAPRAQRGIVPFVAVVGAPVAEINPFPFFFDAGVVVRGPFEARPDDDMLFGVVYGAFSSALRDQQRTQGMPLQDFEMVLEWTYVIQVTPWFQLSPNVQYVIRPGGTGEIPDALVAGLQIGLSL
ncbi:MAG: carbohydrate porin [Candidatus Binatia bacterium]